MSPRRPKGSVPNLCKRKDGRGYVTDPYSRLPVYFGRHGTLECQRLYDAWVKRLLDRRANTEAPAAPVGRDATVAELILAYLAHADRYYVKHGQPTSETQTLRSAFDALNELHGTAVAGEFGASDLKDVRKTWIARKLARSTVNGYTGRVRRLFRWAVEEELVAVEVLQRLESVRDLPLGRSGARETEPVPPVPLEHVEAVLAVAKPRLAAMIRLQLLASMRPQDVCNLRGEDIDRTQTPWLYKPWTHKTEHKGKGRIIPLGPKAREILTPLLEARPTDWLFPGQDRSKPVQSHSYTVAIGRVCEKARIPHWASNRLRHAGLTAVRAKHGLEGAQVIAGHAHASTTEIYASANLDLAKRIAEENG